MALFGEKYGDEVRVLTMGRRLFSVESLWRHARTRTVNRPIQDHHEKRYRLWCAPYRGGDRSGALDVVLEAERSVAPELRRCSKGSRETPARQTRQARWSVPASLEKDLDSGRPRPPSAAGTGSGLGSATGR